ncbi:hypothetical protein TNCV_1871251 [Trichonephila clavipes]|nr:hypothetical protein TNCV_1871251 [Trichonephila clavipes]
MGALLMRLSLTFYEFYLHTLNPSRLGAPYHSYGGGYAPGLQPGRIQAGVQHVHPTLAAKVDEFIRSEFISYNMENSLEQGYSTFVPAGPHMYGRYGETTRGLMGKNTTRSRKYWILNWTSEKNHKKQ